MAEGGNKKPQKKRSYGKWSEMKKAAKARKVENSSGNSDSYHKNQDNRRNKQPTEVHKGSYAVEYFAAKAAKEAENKETEEVKKLPPKKKFALLIAYCGVNYSGMQMNPGIKTIEAELEKALFEVDAISESNYGFLQKIGWTRAARTDKGVHTAGQIVSAKLHVDLPENEFVQKLNSKLPEDIRVIECVRTTQNFSSKIACDKRTYEYLAPTFLFAPYEGDNKLSGAAQQQSAKLEDIPPLDSSTLQSFKDFRISTVKLEKLRKALSTFDGSHNFHNYTSKLEPTDAKCRRYILSFEAQDPFLVNGIEWVRLKVVGQSFLLHHIRKMIGMVVEVVRGSIDTQIISKSFELPKMDLPKAPGVGLYLAQAHFDLYNEKFGMSHTTLDFSSDTTLEKIESFKKKWIFQFITSQEEENHSFGKWLQVLNLNPLSYEQIPWDTWKNQKRSESLDKESENN